MDFPDIDMPDNAVCILEKDLNDMLARQRALEEALEFYANRMTYVSRSGMDSPLRRDNFGDRARKLLKLPLNYPC